MTAYPLPTLAPTIDSTGISAPVFADILASLQASTRNIFGQDLYLEEDSQDGAFLAIFAKAIADNNGSIIADYNARAPSTAIGAGLSSIVKLNGIRRESASLSTVDVIIEGDAGLQINNGQVGDTLNQAWNLPSQVTIGTGGTVTVTATAASAGAVQVGSGLVTKILTPTAGWLSVTNTDAAAPGNAVEDDATLRKRQATSTALPSQTRLESIEDAISNLSGVTRFRAYENDSDTTDGNGIPSHSICLVVEGGDALAIATAIGLNTLGCGTYGTVSELILDSRGVPKTISFDRPTPVRTTLTVNLTALTGYVSTTGQAIKDAASAYVNALGIGVTEYFTKMVSVCNLNDGALTNTFNVTSIAIGRYGGSAGTADLTMAFNEAAGLANADIVLNVTS